MRQPGHQPVAGSVRPCTTSDVLYAPAANAAPLAAHFERLQQFVLRSGFEVLPVQQLMIGCLVAFDSIPKLEDLSKVLVRVNKWSDELGGVSVAWVSGDRLHRRVLSELTSRCWRSLPRHSFDWKLEVAAFASAYRNHIRSLACMDEFLADIFKWSRAWHDLHLPPLLAAHLSGELPLNCLSDLAWKRQFNNSTAQAPADDTDQMESTFLELLAPQSIEQRKTSGEWFVARLKLAFDGCTGAGVNLSNARSRQKLIRNLDAMRLEMHGVGVRELLLYGWLIDMLRHGSARRERPAIRTLYLYIHAASDRLLQAMKEFDGDLHEIDAEDWMSIYASAQQKPRTAPVLAAALMCFHRFLVRFLGVEPLSGRHFGEADRPAPANCVWPHEFAATRLIIDEATAHERVKAQSLVMLSLLEHTSLRKAEIDGLRLCSVQRGDGRVWITVAPRRGSKSLKSAAARRLLAVTDPAACAVIVGWFNQRRMENASANDLLFGDPHLVDRLFAPGDCYRLLLRSLKAATGDPSVVLHSCRHGFASRAIAEALKPGTFHQISQISLTQQMMGHASVSTTVQTYFHQYERALRMWVDGRVYSNASSFALSRWEGCTAAAIRKRRSRNTEALCARLPLICERQAVRRLDERLVQLPSEVHTESITAHAIRRILVDVQRGLAPDSICSRNSCPESFLLLVASSIKPGGQAGGGEKQSFTDRVAAARESLAHLDFSRLSEARWHAFLSKSNSLDEVTLQGLVSNWSKYGSKFGLCLTEPDSSAELLVLMRDAGFTAGRMLIRSAARDRTDLAVDADEQKKWAQIQVKIKESFRASIRVEQVNPRGGRPSRYLFPLTQVCETSPPPAYVDAKSLVAAMACITLSFSMRGSNDRH